MNHPFTWILLATNDLGKYFEFKQEIFEIQTKEKRFAKKD